MFLCICSFEPNLPLKSASCEYTQARHCLLRSQRKFSPCFQNSNLLLNKLRIRWRPRSHPAVMHFSLEWLGCGSIVDVLCLRWSFGADEPNKEEKTKNSLAQIHQQVSFALISATTSTLSCVVVVATPMHVQ